MQTIVTHVSPDLDAIASAWLLLRYVPNFEGAKVVFVNTGNPDRAILAQADAVVDTGGAYNPYQYWYDHHQMENPNETCAAMLVWRKGVICKLLHSIYTLPSNSVNTL